MPMTAFTVLLATLQLCVMRFLLFSGKVATGFPSPANDYIEKNLDLKYLEVTRIKHPVSYPL